MRTIFHCPSFRINNNKLWMKSIFYQPILLFFFDNFPALSWFSFVISFRLSINPFSSKSIDIYANQRVRDILSVYHAPKPQEEKNSLNIHVYISTKKSGVILHIRLYTLWFNIRSACVMIWIRICCSTLLSLSLNLSCRSTQKHQQGVILSAKIEKLFDIYT